MKKLTLKRMTRELCHEYFREFTVDPDLFAVGQPYRPYVYDRDQCDAYFDRHVRLGRAHLAVMLDDEAIGELVLKNIDPEKKCCELGISMKNDDCKNRGYGTQAERLALEYAFTVMGLETVYADALRGNTRSQHVLKKAGFTETHRDESFIYYRHDKTAPKPAEHTQSPAEPSPTPSH